MRWQAVLLTFALLAASAACGRADGASARLHHNPFDHPELQLATAAETTEKIRSEPAPIILKLRATAVSVTRTMANVNGVLLVPGEEIEGYRLLEVGEGSAVLEKNGQRRTLTLLEESP